MSVERDFLAKIAAQATEAWDLAMKAKTLADKHEELLKSPEASRTATLQPSGLQKWAGSGNCHLTFSDDRILDPVTRLERTDSLMHEMHALMAKYSVTNFKGELQLKAPPKPFPTT